MTGLYRLYIDEVGNHALTYVDDPNERFLSLTGVMLESGYTLAVLQPEMDAIKRQFFQRDPDEPIIFHRKEMVNRRSPFHPLRSAEVEREFNEKLLAALYRWVYQVITIVIDKKAHRDQYRVWHYHPYHYCMAVMLERFVLLLEQGDARGDVWVESRGGREDGLLKDSYERLYRDGTMYIAALRWRQRPTSSALKVKPKSANISGLQLADLVAHPSRREVLLEHGLITDERNTFGDQISATLQSKYYRNPRTGRVEGAGKKLLP